MILSRALDGDIAAETDLHERLANRDYVYEEDDAAEAAFREFAEYYRRYPAGETRTWEDEERIRARVPAVLRRYAAFPKVIVIWHGMRIQAVTGAEHSKTGEIVSFSLSDT